jgi:hypothetical protein
MLTNFVPSVNFLFDYGLLFQIGAVVYFMGWLLIQWDNARPMRGSAEHETASAHGTARWARWRDITKAFIIVDYPFFSIGNGRGFQLA